VSQSCTRNQYERDSHFCDNQQAPHSATDDLPRGASASPLSRLRGNPLQCSRAGTTRKGSRHSHRAMIKKYGRIELRLRQSCADPGLNARKAGRPAPASDAHIPRERKAASFRVRAAAQPRTRRSQGLRSAISRSRRWRAPAKICKRGNAISSTNRPLQVAPPGPIAAWPTRVFRGEARWRFRFCCHPQSGELAAVARVDGVDFRLGTRHGLARLKPRNHAQVACARADLFRFRSRVRKCAEADVGSGIGAGNGNWPEVFRRLSRVCRPWWSVFPNTLGSAAKWLCQNPSVMIAYVRSTDHSSSGETHVPKPVKFLGSEKTVA